MHFAGFVITFAAGAAYDGAHFAWFAERYDDYCYLDRIVIHEDFQRRGLGTFVYDELEGSCGRPVFALEVNIDPPNEPSLAFHRARGFAEVGQSDASGHLVALMVEAAQADRRAGPRGPSGSAPRRRSAGGRAAPARRGRPGDILMQPKDL